MISRALHNKLYGIIHAHDVRALKDYAHRNISSKIPGTAPLSYSMYGENGPIGYLLNELTNEEQVELQNFTIDDLNAILYKDEGLSLPFGIQHMDFSNRNIPKKKAGRWGL